MSYIQFDKKHLTNLGFALRKEFVRTNRSGSYASSTVIGCNTRKYHGLLVVPQSKLGGGNHVLLSSLDLTVMQNGASFNLAIHKYKGGEYNPKGHKYMREYRADPIPKIIYRVGGVVLSVESIFSDKNASMFLKYTLLEAKSKTTFRIKPLLAFRNIHDLTQANSEAITSYKKVENGFKMQLYKDYTPLYLQFSKAVEYIHHPEWYKDFEYMKEIKRGYDGHEDLLAPGDFEFTIKKGESVILQASIEEGTPNSFSRQFGQQLKKRVPRDGFKNNLTNAAQQFLIEQDGKTNIAAGLPWKGSCGRDTFIALPGLMMAIGDEKKFIDILDTWVEKQKDGFFPNKSEEEKIDFYSADTSLWFFWTLQKYIASTNKAQMVWKKYAKPMLDVIEAYQKGNTELGIHMHSNGLIYTSKENIPLSWMDAILFGKAVTPRAGYAVEINALWYNAIAFYQSLEKEFGKETQNKTLNLELEKVGKSFLETFTDIKHNYLADYTDGENKSWDVRPNMLIAASLPYTPFGDEMRKSIFDVVKQELLTPRGIRSLSPKNPKYKSKYEGNIETRDNSYHNGAVWPWLLISYADLMTHLYGRGAISEIQTIVQRFEEEMTEHGIGSISELYNGDPPYEGKGGVSQAWSVAAIISLLYQVENNNNKTSQI
ncbi:MAG: glycogen debranching enzyme N-terminal domain-containing protein [Bacteroidales bacterium]|jgi:predicted glycogen debranching enzyme|nr:glycogen debranching enzyme N-terminal domain-containing protein [Bacteroidales bacterium]